MRFNGEDDQFALRDEILIALCCLDSKVLSI